MEVYEIRNHIKKLDLPVKSLYQTKHMILHRSTRCAVDSKSRHYVMSLKRNELCESDLIIGSFSDLKIKNCTYIMDDLEKDFDLSDSDSDKLVKNEEFRNAVRRFR